MDVFQFARDYADIAQSVNYEFDEPVAVFCRKNLEEFVERIRAQERDRCASIARRWGLTHEGHVTANARNSAEKIAKAIESVCNEAGVR